jgi:hypothetical protein
LDHRVPKYKYKKTHEFDRIAGTKPRTTKQIETVGLVI